VGTGPAAQVDRYLASRAGSKRPAPPAGQAFWLAEASGGDAATLRWDVRDGDYRLVLMNADGSVGVRADGEVGVTVPLTSSIVRGLLGGGLVLLLGGVATSALSLREDASRPARSCRSQCHCGRHPGRSNGGQQAGERADQDG
jgi:hypothetical protein